MKKKVFQGVSIKNLYNHFYDSFYSDSEKEIIEGRAEAPTRQELKRLIKKAERYEDHISSRKIRSAYFRILF